jgi:hypothetical protein
MALQAAGNRLTLPDDGSSIHPKFVAEKTIAALAFLLRERTSG